MTGALQEVNTPSDTEVNATTTSRPSFTTP